MQAQPCWQVLLPILARRVRGAPLTQPRYGEVRYRDTAPALLALAVGLFRLPHVRERWVSAPAWRDAFEALLTLRQPTPRDLRALVPRAHWRGAAGGGRQSPEGISSDPVGSCPGEAARGVRLSGLGSGADEGEYRAACAALAAAAAAVEERHLELCAVLAATPTLLTGATRIFTPAGRVRGMAAVLQSRMNLSSCCQPSTALSHCAVEALPVTPMCRLAAGVPSEPSTRLSQFAAHLLRKNRGAARAMPPPGLSDASALRGAFVALARLLRPALEGAHGPLPPFPAGAYFLAVRALGRHARGGPCLPLSLPAHFRPGLAAYCLSGVQGVAKGGLDRYGDAPRVGGELGHLVKTLAPDPASFAVALHVARAGASASTRAGAEAAGGSPVRSLADLNQLVRRCLLPRPRDRGAALAEVGGGAPLERGLEPLAVRPAPGWPAAACDCLCRVSSGASSCSGSFTSGAGACAGLERARSGDSSASGSEAGPCVPLEHARSAPSTLQSGRWGAALRRAHLDRAPSGSGTLDRASGSWRAAPHDERGRRGWGRKRRASAPGERVHGDYHPLQGSSLAQRSRSDGAWLAAPSPAAPQRPGMALVGGTAEAAYCTVSAAGAAGGEPRPGLGRGGLGGQGCVTPSGSPGGAPAPLDGAGCQSWGSGLVGWQPPQKWRAESPCPGVGSPMPGQSAAELSRWPMGPGSTHVLPSADQWPPLQRAGGPESELWPAPCGGFRVDVGLEAGFAGAAREAPALVDAAVRLYSLGAAGAFRSAGAAAAAVAAAQAELVRAEKSLQVRRITHSGLGRGAASLRSAQAIHM